MNSNTSAIPSWVTTDDSLTPISTDGRSKHWKQHRRKALRAQQMRIDLIKRLGAKCANCDCEDLSLLEVDHPEGRSWSMRKKSQITRIKILLHEEKKGLLQVLCRSCNAKDGGYKRWPRK